MKNKLTDITMEEVVELNKNGANITIIPTQEPMEWELRFPLSTFHGETKHQLIDLIAELIKQAEERGYDKGFDAGGQTKGGTGRIMYQRGQEEYKQFILNLLDGVEEADKAMNNKGGGTLAIRHAINSRII